MITYFPMHVHSHYSLLDGLSKPEDIAQRCTEIGVDGAALTDHGNISGHIKFLQAMKRAKKKAVLGCEFYVCANDAAIKTDSNRNLHHLCILAKNTAGWKALMQLVSLANTEEFFYYKPRLDLNRMTPFCQNNNLIAFSGHMGSELANSLFDSNGDLSAVWKQNGCKVAKVLQEIFGQDNFYIEIQLMDQINLPKQKTIAECLRQISKETHIPCIATPDAHYAFQSDAEDQRILLCANMKTTIEQASKPEFGMSGFFRSRQYYIPSPGEMQQWHTPEELENTMAIASYIGDYNVLRSPILPQFKCPDDMDQDQYLKYVCDLGWNEKIVGKIPIEQHDEYRKRLELELSTLQGAKLSSYFLIVRDIIQFVKHKGWIPGPGRGSAAGCLVSYLIGITLIDPIKYGLLFERFYNAGRNTADNISMPDIDMDVPKYAREHVINYIREKYGTENVGQMVTFQTMKGRGAIKDVLRAYGGISFDEMNEITKNIIEEHKISDELQSMKEDRGESSIIQWCLENTGERLKKWCSIQEDGSLGGPLAHRFQQAIRLEGTKANVSKHAAGVVIAPEPLHNICPMIFDKESKRVIAGFEMDDLESVGGIKFDVLGITALDKIMGIASDLSEGKVQEIQ